MIKTHRISTWVGTALLTTIALVVGATVTWYARPVDVTPRWVGRTPPSQAEAPPAMAREADVGLVFDPPLLDFGPIDRRLDIITRVVTIRNLSAVPRRIVGFTVRCGCLSVQQNEPFVITPEGSYALAIMLDSRVARPGIQAEEIVVTIEESADGRSRAPGTSPFVINRLQTLYSFQPRVELAALDVSLALRPGETLSDAISIPVRISTTSDAKSLTANPSEGLLASLSPPADPVNVAASAPPPAALRTLTVQARATGASGKRTGTVDLSVSDDTLARLHVMIVEEAQLTAMPEQLILALAEPTVREVTILAPPSLIRDLRFRVITDGVTATLGTVPVTDVEGTTDAQAGSARLRLQIPAFHDRGEVVLVELYHCDQPSDVLARITAVID